MQIQPSQISAVRYGEVRAPRPEPAPETPVRETEAQPARDRTDFGGLVPPGESTSERVDAFADKIGERLANLAAETGQDLSEVQASFDGFVQRIQDGIGDGSLEGADLERGVRNALALTTSSVRDALGLDGAEEPQGGMSPAERIDAFEMKVNERLGAIAQDADPETIAALREAQQTFAAGLADLRDGLAGGSFDASNIGRGVEAAIASLGEGVQEALAEPNDNTFAAEDEQEIPAESTLSPRIDAFAATIAERLANLDLNGVDGQSVRDAGAEFLSLLEGLSTGSSDGLLTDRQTTSMFQRALAGFSGEMQEMFGRSAGEMMLYGRDAERLA